jgi:hypothetical protein
MPLDEVSERISGVNAQVQPSAAPVIAERRYFELYPGGYKQASATARR